jgi:hypothetical protein
MISITLIAAGILIGVMLGLTGGGGSLLSVPALIYLAGLPIRDAIANSLAIVTLTSLVALSLQIRHKRINWRVGITFSFVSVVGAFVGAKMAVWVPALIILLLFYSVMLSSGYSMISKAIGRSANFVADVSSLRLAGLGFSLGAFTGLVGAGGGFLVVPVLVIYAGLGMKTAVGTSLLVVSLKSFAAFLGYSSHATIDYQLIGYITVYAALGACIGVSISSRIRDEKLQLLFGGVLFCSALLLGGYEIINWLAADL